MPVSLSGVHAESGHKTRSLVSAALLAALVAAAGLISQPHPARAAALKVVVVVGPVGSSTASFLDSGKRIAAEARSYGAQVYEIYTPYATWDVVKKYAQGANLLVYLGHGNGWPSPYPPFQTNTKDGMGLNAQYNQGHYNHKYYGEYWMQTYIKLAPDAVVLLNRLCYASGNSEPGHAYPTLSVANQRVDNYAAGFLRTGAKAVFAQNFSGTSYILYGLFRTNWTMYQIFWTAPSQTYIYRSYFWSSRTPGIWGVLDPSSPGKYLRSLIGWQNMTAGAWRT